jgi:tRNA pseudouridine55 synthase
VDGTRAAWQQSPVGGSSDGSFALTATALSSVAPASLAAKATSFQLRDGVLAWVETPTTTSRALKASAGSTTSTLSSLSTATLLANGGGRVAYGEGGKTYTGEIQLGARTDTGDAEGAVIESAAVPSLPLEFDALARRFTGEITQQPPNYSALKHQGRPLYEYARAGTPVAAKPRSITIHALSLVQIGPDRLGFEVTCSSGTYVRSLAEDLSVALGTVGHLAMLRRTASGGFRVEDAISPEALERLSMAEREARLFPPDALLRDVPEWDVDAATAALIRQGRVVPASSGLAAGRVRLYAPGRVFLGLGEADAAGRVQPLRLLATGGEKAGRNDG